jgi:hypothetical protein
MQRLIFSAGGCRAYMAAQDSTGKCSKEQGRSFMVFYDLNADAQCIIMITIIINYCHFRLVEAATKHT